MSSGLHHVETSPLQSHNRTHWPGSKWLGVLPLLAVVLLLALRIFHFTPVLEAPFPLSEVLITVFIGLANPR